MSKLFSRSSQVAIDVAVLALAYWAAFLLRFDWDLPSDMVRRLLVTGPYVIAAQYLALSLLGVPRFSWRFIGLREMIRIWIATGAAAALFLAVRAGSIVAQPIFSEATSALIPLGIILMNFVLVFLGIGGVRVARRIFGERQENLRRHAPSTPAVATLLIGAGRGGLVIAKEIAGRPDLGLHAVGFLDDDPVKVGSVVHGFPVLGTTAQLVEVCEKHEVHQVIITISNAPGKEIRRIADACKTAKIPAKIIPGIYEIVGGQVNLSRLRNVTIDDLLRREPVHLELDAIEELVRGRVVLVTGAGGSIGSELCRQLCGFSPAQLVLVEQAENALYEIHRELKKSFPGVAVMPRVADICDVARLRTVFATHRPSTVFHAAAHKHVPMMEWNPGEAIKNNVFGTKTLADMADSHDVEAFVMISTDKAVNPTSVMGVSKRTAEIYVQALSGRSKTRFTTVRFGNVLGSAGSVIPLFQEQIERGGPVTVTHPEMKRYFMTIPEACQLVLQSACLGKGDEIFILDMGEPVKIVDLAHDLIQLSGLQPGEDIEIEFSGIRPGEKLFEELSVAEEEADRTRHPKIFVGKIRPHDWDDVLEGLELLRGAADQGDPAAVRARFRQLVPEYEPVVLEEPAKKLRAVS